MGTVYILQSLVNNRYYIGSTPDLKLRLEQHNAGKSKYTVFSRPFKLVFSQEYPTLTEARKIEYKLKRMKSRQLIERIILDKIIKLRA